jgi:hypothetical protein
MLLVANLFRRAILFHGLGFCGRSVLICSTHVYRIVAPKPAVPSKHISTQYTFPKKKTEISENKYMHENLCFLIGSQTKDKRVTADDVAKMWDVVDVRQGAGDEDVPLAFDRKLPGLPLHCDVVAGISHFLPTLRANRERREEKRRNKGKRLNIQTNK